MSDQFDAGEMFVLGAALTAGYVYGARLGHLLVYVTDGLSEMVADGIRERVDDE